LIINIWRYLNDFRILEKKGYNILTFSLRTGPVKSITKEMYEAKLKQYDSELNGIEDKLKRADVH